MILGGNGTSLESGNVRGKKINKRLLIKRQVLRQDWETRERKTKERTLVEGKQEADPNLGSWCPYGQMLDK